MGTQKILQINPELFQFNGGKKSLKKKERKTKPIQDKTQSLKSNKLKKELLKKVKDYQKNKETEVIKDEKSKEKNEAMPGSNLFDSKDFENNDFEREFNKSLTFLHDLSKKNKDKNKKKTLKLSNTDVNIDIPKDSLIYNSGKEPSYGCLKNGSKPTFRDLNKTQKHNINNTNNTNTQKRLQLALENNTYYDHSEFHNKYQTHTNDTTETNKPNIELKITEQTSQETSSSANLSNNKPLSKVNNEIITASYDYTNNYPSNKETLNIIDINKNDINKNNINKNDINKNNINKNDIKEEILTNKEDNLTNETILNKEDSKEELPKEESYIPKLRRITRTYKYKLGKKKDSKHIGLLIKNRETQKKIKQEVSQLKQQPIQNVKNFLREKNLIKLGSQAPNDVLRRLYEDSMLAGEITNTNNNNLVHNYLNDV
jgi:hypothetical protein